MSHRKLLVPTRLERQPPIPHQRHRNIGIAAGHIIELLQAKIGRHPVLKRPLPRRMRTDANKRMRPERTLPRMHRRHPAARLDLDPLPQRHPLRTRDLEHLKPRPTLGHQLRMRQVAHHRPRRSSGEPGPALVAQVKLARRRAIRGRGAHIGPQHHVRAVIERLVHRHLVVQTAPPKAPVAALECAQSLRPQGRRSFGRTRGNLDHRPILDHPQDRLVGGRTQRPLPVVRRLIRTPPLCRQPGRRVEQRRHRQVHDRIRARAKLEVRLRHRHKQRRAGTHKVAARAQVLHHIVTMLIGKGGPDRHRVGREHLHQRAHLRHALRIPHHTRHL